jgi:hypothetical protein
VRLRLQEDMGVMETRMSQQKLERVVASIPALRGMVWAHPQPIAIH